MQKRKTLEKAKGEGKKKRAEVFHHSKVFYSILPRMGNAVGVKVV